MHTTEPTSSAVVEAFLLIEQPRQRLSHWAASLASLDSPLAPRPDVVIAYYDPTSDQALLNLQYDADALGANKLEFVVNVALLAEVGMVQPAELSEGERARFLAARLSRCTLRVTGTTTAVGALTELVKRIKNERTAQSTSARPQPPQPPPIPAAAKTRSLSPRGDAPPLDDPPSITAKGTRDNLSRLPTTDLLNPPTSSRHVVSRAQLNETVELPPVTFEPISPSDRTTSPVNIEELQAIAARAPSDSELTDDEDYDYDPPRPTSSPFVRHRASSEPYVPTSQRAGIIYARYLRGGRWVPVRVGALSLKGAALLAGALPRIADRVDVALTFGNHRALVRGTVAKVSTVREAAQTGASTFTVIFELDTVSKRQLTALLVAARDAKVTIKPPPPRATRRFPVEWHVALTTAMGTLDVTALDVSTAGMFVRSRVALELGSTVGFSAVLDDGGAPVTGRAKVVRKITESEARVCGLAAGFGLGIVVMTEAERMRWLGFLARIERRAEKRVLIGAEPARLAELQAVLASLGYAVTGGTDPGALVQLANGDARPADAVLIDAGWLHNETSVTLVESLFSARNVPCVTMQGEARRARQAIDRLLDVVV